MLKQDKKVYSILNGNLISVSKLLPLLLHMDVLDYIKQIEGQCLIYFLLRTLLSNFFYGHILQLNLF